MSDRYKHIPLRAMVPALKGRKGCQRFLGRKAMAPVENKEPSTDAQTDRARQLDRVRDQYRIAGLFRVFHLVATMCRSTPKLVLDLETLRSVSSFESLPNPS